MTARVADQILAILHANFGKSPQTIARELGITEDRVILELRELRTAGITYDKDGGKQYLTTRGALRKTDRALTT